MTSFTPAPKPLPSSQPPHQQGSRRWNSTIRATPSKLKRSAIDPRKLGKTKLRRIKEYDRYLRSLEWQAIRQAAFKRDGGLCQCPDCIAFRAKGNDPEATRIDIWIRRGRVYGFSTHHTYYPPDIWQTRLEHVVTTIPLHHGIIEARTGKRQAWMMRGVA